MSDDDPIPEAVRRARHVHVALSNQHVLYDYGQAVIASEARERAYWEGLRQVVREELVTAAVASDPDEIDYKRDWAGECRIDPGDGNAYVLRSISGGQSRTVTSGPGDMVVGALEEITVWINDVHGGHGRQVPLDEWLLWIRA